MGTVLLVVPTAVVTAIVLTGLVRAGRREAHAERVRIAEEAQRRARRSLEAVWAMDGRRFEEYIAQLCRRDGCTEVQRVGGAGDLGADVIGRLPDGRKIVIQCKRYAKHRTVGSRDIQTFNGTARAEHHADVPVFVASCVFTKPARAFADRHHLTLIDIDLLGFWNDGTALTSFLDLDIARSGTNRKLRPDRDRQEQRPADHPWRNTS
ncbi:MULTISPECIES: restriction endonuclease [Streptomyces]|uniref:Restriction endonuclease n=1 Tax=Streptomyces flavovirens TaxID=52258 RepID=A0ABV8MXH1_9ACTN|nr:restriction endonuclease [Streptomyces sp. MBT51]MBK3593784.1 restriction endonuclease [Streptomyces sp. MBT51]HBF84977.1 restriction endonuclease [Streptomyces sp.]